MKLRAKQLWVMMAAMSLTGVSFTSTAGEGTPAGSTAAANAKTSSAGMITGATPTAGPTVTAPASGGTSIGSSAGATIPVPPAGQLLVANKVAAPFVGMAGSQDNAVALATALRTGTTANLTFLSTSPAGATTPVTTVVSIPTKPMGWGNVSHALALAQFSLRQAGIDNPTAADLQAALDGGIVTTVDGKTVTLAGVLQQRAQGMGWGQIAKANGTTMGALNRGVKASTTAVASSTSTQTGTAAATKGAVVTGATHGHGAKGIMTASGAASNNSGLGHGSKGLTTASGALANNGSNGHAAKGITTATNATAGASSGLVTAAGNGQGNALGRGVVTAAGGGSSATVGGRGGTSGVVTGAGATPNPSTTHESSGNAGGHGKHSG